MMPDPKYRLRGRFASRHAFTVPEELVSPSRVETTSLRPWPRWYSGVAFFAISLASIFAMCAMGRPGA